MEDAVTYFVAGTTFALAIVRITLGFVIKLVERVVAKVPDEAKKEVIRPNPQKVDGLLRRRGRG